MESWKLPEEITSDILSRLPVKSVMRCKCVCKLWRVLLKCPHFINMHLTRSSQSNNPSLLFSTIESERTNNPQELIAEITLEFNVYLVEHILQVTVIDTPLPRLSLPPYDAPSDWLDSHSSCNGLLLLSTLPASDMENVSVLISNPFTRETLELPQFSPSYGSCRSSYALGYHPTTKEYKVLRLAFVSSSSQSYKLIAEVHTLGTTSWRSKGEVLFMITWEAYSVQVNNVLHWLAEYPISSDNMAISSFGIADEEFQFFPVPSQLHYDGDWRHIKLQELRGYLCLVDYSTGNYVDIWVMKLFAVEESWIKLYVVPIPGTVHSFSLIWQMEDGVIILEHDNMIISYDPNNNQLAQLAVQVPQILCRSFVHVGTLVSPTQII